MICLIVFTYVVTIVSMVIAIWVVIVVRVVAVEFVVVKVVEGALIIAGVAAGII